MNRCSSSQLLVRCGTLPLNLCIPRHLSALTKLQEGTFHVVSPSTVAADAPSAPCELATGTVTPRIQLPALGIFPASHGVLEPASDGEAKYFAPYRGNELLSPRQAARRF